MSKLIISTCLMLLMVQCNSIKNENARVSMEEATVTDGHLQLEDGSKLYGFWVGNFEMDYQEDEWPEEEIEEDFEYSKKINISIDKIADGKIEGHSVVAGNYRPFTGSITKDSGRYFVEAKEPGDHPHDGVFKFQMNDTMLYGTWVAYDKKDSVHRKYELKRRVFKYDPETMLDKVISYVDYKKVKEQYIKLDDGMDSFITEFNATATDKIYEINASNTMLTAADVSNLKKGDLLIIRNAVYARHGYSFKNKALRMFFDAQEWYIPVNSDIKDALTEIEKSNIELLMTYEKNAEEYYDHFGRF